MNQPISTEITAVSRDEMKAAIQEVEARCSPDTAQLMKALDQAFQQVALELDEQWSLVHTEGPRGSGICLARAVNG